MTRFELHAPPATSEDESGGLMAFTASHERALRWCKESPGATAIDTETGTTLGTPTRTPTKEGEQ